ncbi:MAG: nucleotide pyrophosphohydrolase [Desulfobulbaceae bacterium]|nr:nucleotide pyrophosphohydrolase [Desulfobulbaceae bacterium]
MQELIEAVRAFRRERDWDQYHSPKNLAMALSVEVAELVEIFQWLTQAQSGNLSQAQLAHVKEEIGDVMIYLANLADKLGLDPLEAAFAKLEMNEKKYPADKARGKSEKYTEYS